MVLWNWLEYAASALSAAFGLHAALDRLRTDSSYSEDVRTSSREGELEAMAEEHAEKHGVQS